MHLLSEYEIFKSNDQAQMTQEDVRWTSLALWTLNFDKKWPLKTNGASCGQLERLVINFTHDNSVNLIQSTQFDKSYFFANICAWNIENTRFYKLNFLIP